MPQAVSEFVDKNSFVAVENAHKAIDFLFPRKLYIDFFTVNYASSRFKVYYTYDII